MKLSRALQTAAFLLIPALTQTAFAGRTVTEEKTIPLKGEKTLETTLDFGAGELELKSTGRSANLFEGRFTFRPGRIEPEVRYSASRTVGRLDLETHSIKKFFSDNNARNEWDLRFSTEVTHAFDINLGACEAKLDFSGLPLEELAFDLGAGDCKIFFNAPNPVEMKRLEINAGASELAIFGLGNARFQKLDFDGGMGDFTLDFSGDFEGDRRADISVGLGSVEIRFPPDLGVRVHKDGALSSVDFDPDLEEVSDGVWESSNYARAKSRLVIDLSIGMGSAELKRAEY
ncbi:MAG: toast rack family protein [candidate division Zixibacteria bacterium]|nr:toast rack family protein [candidate division Zixibacteria bacterium]